MKGRGRVVKREKHQWIDGKGLLWVEEEGRVGEREREEARQMERGDSAEREEEREEERDRKGEGLCLISGPGECLGWAKKEHGMFSNWPCFVEREGSRKKQEAQMRQAQEGGEEKREKRLDFRLVDM